MTVFGCADVVPYGLRADDNGCEQSFVTAHGFLRAKLLANYYKSLFQLTGASGHTRRVKSISLSSLASRLSCVCTQTCTRRFRRVSKTKIWFSERARSTPICKDGGWSWPCAVVQVPTLYVPLPWLHRLSFILMAHIASWVGRVFSAGGEAALRVLVKPDLCRHHSGTE